MERLNALVHWLAIVIGGHVPPLLDPLSKTTTFPDHLMNRTILVSAVLCIAANPLFPFPDRLSGVSEKANS
jgi:cytochrome c oxidase assembly factor CtaG